MTLAPMSAFLLQKSHKFFNLFKRFDWHLCLLLLSPILLLFANQTWFFPWSGESNDWVNYSYFLDYFHLSTPYFDDYRVARLAWILKGWFFNKIFPPAIAYYALNLFILYTYTVVPYFILKLLLNRTIALPTSLMVLSLSSLLSAPDFGWYYFLHDAIANSFITLLLLLLATRSPRWKLYLFLAGAACASAFQATFVTIYGFSFIFWYCYLNKHSEHKHPLLVGALFFGLGMIAITIFYGCINVLAGGPFLFFLQTIPGLSNRSGPWFPDKFHPVNKDLIFPAVAVILSIISLFFLNKRTPENVPHPYKQAILLGLISFLLCIPIAILFQYFGVPTLVIRHFIFGMYPFLFIAIAAVLAAYLPTQNQPNSSVEWLSALIAFIIIVGGLVFGYDISTLRTFHLNLSPIISTTLFGQLSLLILAIILLWRKKQYKTYALSFFTALTSIFFTPIFYKLVCSIPLLALMIYSLYRTKNENLQLSKWVKWSTAVIFFSILYLAFTYDSSKVIPIFSSNRLSYIFNNPYLWVINSCLFFGPLVACLCIFQKNIKKYSIIIVLSSLFTLINIGTTDVYTASYLPGFKFYIKPEFLATLKGISITRREAANYPTFFWYKDNETVIDHQDNAAAFLGANQLILYMTPIYQSISTANSVYVFNNLVKSDPTFFNTTLVQLLKQPYLKSAFSSPWILGSKNYPIGYIVSRWSASRFCKDLSSTTSNVSFSSCPALKAWLYLAQRDFKLVMLTNDLKDVEPGEQLLKKQGYLFSDKHTYHVHDGAISYYIIAEKVSKNAQSE